MSAYDDLKDDARLTTTELPLRHRLRAKLAQETAEREHWREQCCELQAELQLALESKDAQHASELAAAVAMESAAVREEVVTVVLLSSLREPAHVRCVPVMRRIQVALDSTQPMIQPPPRAKTCIISS